MELDWLTIEGEGRFGGRDEDRADMPLKPELTPEKIVEIIVSTAASIRYGIETKKPEYKTEADKWYFAGASNTAWFALNAMGYTAPEIREMFDRWGRGETPFTMTATQQKPTSQG